MPVPEITDEFVLAALEPLFRLIHGQLGEGHFTLRATANHGRPSGVEITTNIASAKRLASIRKGAMTNANR